jgi:hypothetical protein
LCDPSPTGCRIFHDAAVDLRDCICRDEVPQRLAAVEVELARLTKSP